MRTTRSAVRSALAAAATATLAAPGGEALAARVGITTGLVVVGDLVGEGSGQEEAVVRDTPNLAARLQSIAEPGAIVIAEGTHRLVTGLFEAVDLGNQALKGFAGGMRAWRVVREAPSASRFEARSEAASPLVGRVRRWTFCSSVGRGHERETARSCCCPARLASASRG